jgi:hypothetical protein
MDRPAEVPKPWALRCPLHKADLIPFRNRVTKCAYRGGEDYQAIGAANLRLEKNWRTPHVVRRSQDAQGVHNDHIAKDQTHAAHRLRVTNCLRWRAISRGQSLRGFEPEPHDARDLGGVVAFRNRRARGRIWTKSQLYGLVRTSEVLPSD